MNPSSSSSSSSSISEGEQRQGTKAWKIEDKTEEDKTEKCAPHFN
jgi:hypothetical protein